MDSKKCPGCSENKPFSAYAKNRTKRDGLQARCRDCRRVEAKDWRDAHHEHRRLYLNAWRKQQTVKRRGEKRSWDEAMGKG